MFFPPFLLMFLFGFIFLLFFVFALVQFGLFAWAFSRLGIPPEYLFSFMFLCIAGSMVNLPLAQDSAGEQTGRVGDHPLLRDALSAPPVGESQ
jgi:uncharacterized membrane protein